MGVDDVRVEERDDRELEEKDGGIFRMWGRGVDRGLYRS